MTVPSASAEPSTPSPEAPDPGDAPRTALFLFDCFDPGSLRKLLDRLPERAARSIQEVVVMLDRPDRELGESPATLAKGHPFDVCLHHPPRELDFGALRKAAFEYGMRRHFDRLAIASGDGRHPVEHLDELLDACRAVPRSLVIGACHARPWRRRHEGMPLLQAAGLRLVHAVQNMILHLRVEDYQSSFRVYSSEALGRIPWQLNSDERDFDAEILVQFRALDAPIVEVEISPAWAEHGGSASALTHAVRVLPIPIGYRLHQLHLTRSHQYMVDRDIHYTLKVSPTGSHIQIIEAIEPGSRVLDLGCSQGLLAGPLREKGVEVVGVDIGSPDRIASDMKEFYQRDLEEDLDLPEERDFDYVVVADVIEHLRNRQRLLRGARRYLKQNGRLIISTPNIAIWFYRLSLLVGRFEYGPRGVLDVTHVHLYTRATFQREVEAAGFRVVKRGVTALPFEVVFEATGRSPVIRGMADFYYALARFWPSMFAYQNILEAEITTLDEEATSSG